MESDVVHDQKTLSEPEVPDLICNLVQKLAVDISVHASGDELDVDNAEAIRNCSNRR